MFQCILAFLSNCNFWLFSLQLWFVDVIVFCMISLYMDTMGGTYIYLHAFVVELLILKKFFRVSIEFICPSCNAIKHRFSSVAASVVVESTDRYWAFVDQTDVRQRCSYHISQCRLTGCMFAEVQRGICASASHVQITVATVHQSNVCCCLPETSANSGKELKTLLYH